MEFIATMPAVYTIRPGTEEPHENWMNWGWCDLRETARLIRKGFGLKWSTRELLERFPVSASEINSKKKMWRPQLKVVIFGKGVPRGLQIHEIVSMILPKLDDRTKKFFVPAGWARNVFHAVSHGGRRLTKESRTREVILVDEKGELVYYY